MSGWDDHGGNAPVIRVVKKKVEGGGHHGGAWKVAYADFVTAMMAFFLVMWIVGMDQQAKDAVQGYFNDPMGYMKQATLGNGVLPGGASLLDTEGALAELASRRRAREYDDFQRISRRLQSALADEAFLGDLADQVTVEVSDEGMRIELADEDGGATFFALGSAGLSSGAQRVLDLVGPEIAAVDNPVVVEGHTDSRPSGQVGYSNWELSADRANAARRRLEAAGLDPAKVLGVRGYADRRLANVDAPLAAANRRITILLPFSDVAASAAPTSAVGPSVVDAVSGAPGS